MCANLQLDAASIPMAMGEPLGSGTFTSNVVLAAVVLFAPQQKVSVMKAAFLRDCSFYVGGTAILAAVAWDGRITLLEALAMVAYYLCFVSFLVYRHYFTPGAADVREEAEQFQEVMSRRSIGSCPEALPPWRPSVAASAEGASAASRADRERAAAAALEAASPRHGYASSSGAAHEHSASAGGVPVTHTRNGCSAAGASNGAVTAAAEASNAAAGCGTQVAIGSFGSAAAQPPSATQRDEAAVALLQDCSTSGQWPNATESLLRGSDAAHQAHAAAHGSAAMSHKYRLRDSALAPLLAALRLTMPAVGMGDGVRYPKGYAIALPIAAPLFAVLSKGLALTSDAPLGTAALAYGLLCSTLASMLMAAVYPADGRHRGALSALFVALTFLMSVLWMDVAASEMVRACKAMGYIHGVNQAMLGVTVLAWANSFPDGVADVSMGREGFPSMAVAACFASPLFTSIAALGITFAVASVVHGKLSFAVDLPLQVAVGFAVASAARYLVLMPLVHRWRLGRWAAVSMLAFYAVFQLVYLWAVAEQQGI